MFASVSSCQSFVIALYFVTQKQESAHRICASVYTAHKPFLHLGHLHLHLFIPHSCLFTSVRSEGIADSLMQSVNSEKPLWSIACLWFEVCELLIKPPVFGVMQFPHWINCINFTLKHKFHLGAAVIIRMTCQRCSLFLKKLVFHLFKAFHNYYWKMYSSWSN